jgi:large subunit ribosomal protein L21
VIRAGGKQLRVSEGAIIQMETQKAKPGDSITFADVLLFSDTDNLNVGTPLVARANVFATVLDVIRSSKVLVFKKKRRKQYRRTRGHRQYLMRVRIDEMGLYTERKRTPEERPPLTPGPGPRKPAEGAAEKPGVVPPKEAKAARKAAPAKKPAPRAAVSRRKSAGARKPETASGKKKAAPKSKSAKASDSKKKKR